MTRIESRPRRSGLGRYLFFIDLDGRAEDAIVAAGIEALRGKAETVRMLGSYQVGGPPPLPAERLPAGQRGPLATIAPQMDAVAEPGHGAWVRRARRRAGSRRHGEGASIGGRVLVLNATFEPIHVCTRPPRDGAAAEGEGRDAGARRAGACAPSACARPAGRDPPRHLRPRPPRRPSPQDHPQGGARPRRLDLPVLRPRAPRPHRRPRDPAQPRRRVGLGEHRRLLRALQPPQGQPAAARDPDAPADDARGRRARTSSSASPRRRSRRPGSRTWRWRPELPVAPD